MSTAAGPHAGAHEGELVHRFTSRAPTRCSGSSPAIRSIAALFGIGASPSGSCCGRRGADDRARRPLTFVLGLLVLQGVVGGIQWWLKLPAEIVWVHVGVATLTWVATLWTVATAGRLEPRRQPAGESVEPVGRPQAQPPAEIAGV